MSLKMACGTPRKRPILVSRHTIIINQFVQVLTMSSFCNVTLRQGRSANPKARHPFDCYSTGARQSACIRTHTHTTCVLFSASTNPTMIMEFVCINRVPKFNCVHCTIRSRPFSIPCTPSLACRILKIWAPRRSKKIQSLIKFSFVFMDETRAKYNTYPSNNVYRGSQQ